MLCAAAASKVGAGVRYERVPWRRAVRPVGLLPPGRQALPASDSEGAVHLVESDDPDALDDVLVY